jgi:excisionase family DNA binding protein
MSAINLTVPDELIEEIVAVVVARLNVQPPAESPYMSVDEAADYMRCKKQRVYDLISARRLTRLKDGTRVLLRRGEIDAYLETRAT